MVTKKADMGIGTLIIFIAMILVAAIAAGVLIQTGTSLQNRALLTGDRARSQVSTFLTVLSISGSDGTNASISDFRYRVKLSPGSDAISLSSPGGVLLSFDTNLLTGDYNYADVPCQPDSSDGSAGDGYYYNSSNHRGIFAVNYLVKGRNHRNGYLVRGDVIELCFIAPGEIVENENLIITFIPLRGSPIMIQTSTPHIMTEERVHLYP